MKIVFYLWAGFHGIGGHWAKCLQKCQGWRFRLLCERNWPGKPKWFRCYESGSIRPTTRDCCSQIKWISMAAGCLRAQQVGKANGRRWLAESNDVLSELADWPIDKRRALIGRERWRIIRARWLANRQTTRADWSRAMTSYPAMQCILCT